MGNGSPGPSGPRCNTNEGTLHITLSSKFGTSLPEII